MKIPFPRGSLVLTTLLLSLSIMPTIVERVYLNEEWIYYFGVPKNYGNYHYIGELLKEKKPIDVAFVGSSNFQTSVIPARIEHNIDLAQLKPLLIENISVSWYGTESVYLRVLDVQKHLKPRMIFTDEAEALNWPHELTRFMARSSLAGIAGLKIKERITLYSISVLAAPRQLWFYLKYKTNHMRLKSETYPSINEYQINRGFVKERLGWLSHYNKNRDDRQPFNDKEIQRDPNPKKGKDCWIVNDQNGLRKELGWTYTPYQTAFLKAVAKSTKRNGVSFVVISMPTHFKQGEFRDFYVERPLYNHEPKSWPTIGFPMKKIFHKDTYLSYYSNESHLNFAGAKLFSDCMAGYLTEIQYEPSN